MVVASIVERDGRGTLDFEDFEGQRLSLIDDGGAGELWNVEFETFEAVKDPGKADS